MFELALLINNHEDENEQYKQAIVSSGLAGQVVVKNNGKDAINYLNSNPDIPDVIFLDINMPIVDGVVFIHEWESMPEIIKDLSRIYILSKNGSDAYLQKMVEGNEVAGIVPKPLTQESCKQIMEN